MYDLFHIQYGSMSGRFAFYLKHIPLHDFGLYALIKTYYGPPVDRKSFFCKANPTFVQTANSTDKINYPLYGTQHSSAFILSLD